MEEQISNNERVFDMSTSPCADAILVPLSEDVQFSEFVSSVLPLLKFSCPSITLFHVIETPITAPLNTESMNGIARKYEEKVKPIAEWFEKQDYSVSIKTAVARSVPNAILEEIGNGDYAFVFMLKRRRSGLRRQFTRSITKQVSEKSSIPVISVLV